MSPSEIKSWVRAFAHRDEWLVMRACEIMEEKLLRMPVPGHLTQALDQAMEEREQVRERAKTAPPPPPEPHISDLTPATRKQLLELFHQEMAKVGLTAGKSVGLMTDEELENRRAFLKKQLAELRKKGAKK